MNEAHPDGSRSGAAAAGGGALSLLAAWAMAFGCAVGWDAIELPGTALYHGGIDFIFSVE